MNHSIIQLEQQSIFHPQQTLIPLHEATNKGVCRFSIFRIVKYVHNPVRNFPDSNNYLSFKKKQS